MTRQLVTLQISNSPLSLARLYGVLRARRVPFTVATSETDDPATLAVTVGALVDRPGAERIAAYCRRLVDVTDVRCANESTCVVQESSLLEVALTPPRLTAILAAHTVVRVVATTDTTITLAIVGPPASVANALAEFQSSEVVRLQRGAPMAFVPASSPTIPVEPLKELH